MARVLTPSGAPYNGEVHGWTYDAIGNRLTNTVNGVPQTYSYFKNGSNPLSGQRLSSDGLNAYTYDANGNTLTRNGSGGNFTFGWDANDRMTSISGAATASYGYDYQGRRASKTEGGVTTTYLYDSLNLCGLHIAQTGKKLITVVTTGGGTVAGALAGAGAGCVIGAGVGLAAGLTAGNLFYGPLTDAVIKKAFQDCMAKCEQERCASMSGGVPCRQF